MCIWVRVAPQMSLSCPFPRAPATGKSHMAAESRPGSSSGSGPAVFPPGAGRLERRAAGAPATSWRC